MNIKKKFNNFLFFSGYISWLYIKLPVNSKKCFFKWLCTFGCSNPSSFSYLAKLLCIMLSINRNQVLPTLEEVFSKSTSCSGAFRQQQRNHQHINNSNKYTKSRLCTDSLLLNKTNCILASRCQTVKQQRHFENEK